MFLPMIIFAQNIHYSIVDTIYFSGKIPKILDSYSKKISSGIIIKCDELHVPYYDSKIESNREFRTISNLVTFNKEAKTLVFTSADALIVTYYCQNLDYVNEIEFYEFIFSNDSLAKNLIEKLNFLYNKKGFHDYIGYKNWFFKRVGNIVFFIDSKEEISINTIKNQLQKNIQLIK